LYLVQILLKLLKFLEVELGVEELEDKGLDVDKELDIYVNNSSFHINHSQLLNLATK